MSHSARVFTAVYFLGCCLAMLLGGLVPGGHGMVAVIAKPWGDSALEVVAKAEGRIVFVRNGSWIVLTEAVDQKFIARLYESGAGFVASSAFAYACARLSGISLENTK